MIKEHWRRPARIDVERVALDTLDWGHDPLEPLTEHNLVRKLVQRKPPPPPPHCCISVSDCCTVLFFWQCTCHQFVLQWENNRVQETPWYNAPKKNWTL